jgi:hypothetical protein
VFTTKEVTEYTKPVGAASATSIVIVPDIVPPVLVPVIVYKVDGLGAVGVPEIIPVEGFSVKPVGKFGLII